MRATARHGVVPFTLGLLVMARGALDASPHPVAATPPPRDAERACEAHPPPMPITPATFEESDAVRDPFRLFGLGCCYQCGWDPPPVPLEDTPIDEVRLVAVTRATHGARVWLAGRGGGVVRLSLGAAFAQGVVIRSDRVDIPDHTEHWVVRRIARGGASSRASSPQVEIALGDGARRTLTFDRDAPR